MKKDLIAFYEEMGKNKDLYDELIRLRVNYSSEKNLKKGEIKNFAETCVVPLGERFGYNFTAKDFIKSISSEQELRGLSGDELKDVSGGANDTRNVILAVASVVAAAGLGFGILSQNSAHVNQSGQGVQAKKDDANKVDPEEGGAGREEDLKNKFSPPTGGGGSDDNFLREENERLKQENLRLTEEVNSKFGGSQGTNDPLVKQLNAEIKKLKAEIEKFRKENKDLRQQNADLNKRGSQSPKRPGAGPTNQQKKTEDFNVDNYFPETNNEHLRNRVEQLEREKGLLHSQVKDLYDEITKQKGEIKGFEKELNSLQSENSRLNNLIGKLQELLDKNGKKESAKLLGENDNLKSAIKNLESSCVALQKEYDSLRAERDELRHKNAELSAYLEVAYEANKNLSKLSDELGLKNIELEDQIRQEREINGELRDKNTQLQARIEEFETHINQLKEENRLLGQNLENAELQMTGLKNEHQDMKNRYDGLTSAYAEQTEELKKAIRENQDLAGVWEENEKLRLEMGQLKTESGALVDEEEKMRRDIESLNNSVLKLEEQIRQEQGSNREFLNQNAQLLDRIKEFETQQAGLKAIIERLEEESHRLNQDLAGVREENEKFRLEIGQLKIENGNLVSKNEEFQRNAKNLHQENQKNKQTVSELKGSNAKLNDEVLRVKSKYDADMRSSKERNDILSKQCASQMKQIKQLQASVKTSRVERLNAVNSYFIGRFEHIINMLEKLKNKQITQEQLIADIKRVANDAQKEGLITLTGPKSKNDQVAAQTPKLNEKKSK